VISEINFGASIRKFDGLDTPRERLIEAAGAAVNLGISLGSGAMDEAWLLTQPWAIS
jgi:hypothetical protein